MVKARTVNYGAQQEVVLMAGLIATEELMDKAVHKDIMSYLNARLLAIRGGYSVLFDLDSKLYVARRNEVAQA